jgi:hypothetical protein
MFRLLFLLIVGALKVPSGQADAERLAPSEGLDCAKSLSQ